MSFKWPRAGLQPGRGTDGEAITFHGLRRTFATEARRQGATVDEIQRLGNWRSPEMVKRYVQLEDERASELLQRVSGSFEHKTDTVPKSAPTAESTSAS